MKNPLSTAWQGISFYAAKIRWETANQYTTSVTAPPCLPDGDSDASTMRLAEPVATKAQYVPSASSSSTRVSYSQGYSSDSTAVESDAAAPGRLQQTPTSVEPLGGALASHLGGPNLFDRVTHYAGSLPVFIVAVLLLALWAVLGAVMGATDTWQIVLQNASSLQCYVSATLLMRQQQNHTRAMLARLCETRSRGMGCVRLMAKLGPRVWTRQNNPGTIPKTAAQKNDTVGGPKSGEEIDATKQAAGDKGCEAACDPGNPGGTWPLGPRLCCQPTITTFSALSNHVASILGSLFTSVVYFLAVLAWLIAGVPLRFSITWQLWANTITALLLTFTTIFLQRLRRQHEEFLSLCYSRTASLDRQMEVLVRILSLRLSDEGATGEIKGGSGSPGSLPEPLVHAQNPVVETPPPFLTRLERIIDVYAYVVGSGIGAALSFLVAIVWLSLGHTMGWSDNWWLIIGTYTGLVGYVDGFILRNVDGRETALVEGQISLLEGTDRDLETRLGIGQVLIVRADNEDLEKGQRDGRGITTATQDEAGSSPRKDESSGCNRRWYCGNRWRVKTKAPATSHEDRPPSSRISHMLSSLCATATASLLSVASVVLLLVIASALKWTVTAQLICNTPTMIVEAFLVLVLLQSHNEADAERRSSLRLMLERHVGIVKKLKSVVGGTECLDRSNQGEDQNKTRTAEAIAGMQPSRT